MLAERILFLRDSRCNVSLRLKPRGLQVFAKNMFRGARLSGDFGEADESGLGEPTAANGVDSNGLIFGGPLQDHGVEILDAARQLRRAAQGVIELIDFLVQSGGALEIGLTAGALAFLFGGVSYGAAAVVGRV